MLKYKIIYGEQYDADFDQPLTETILLTTPNNVLPEDVISLVSSIYEYVAYHVYLYNKNTKEYDDRDLDKLNNLKRKSLDMKSYLELNKILRANYILEEDSE